MSFPDNLATTPSSGPELNLRFRNYIPLDLELSGAVEPLPKVVAQVEALYQRKIEKMIAEQKQVENEPVNAMPEKPDSDIKERLRSKLELLERRTHLAALMAVKESQ